MTPPIAESTRALVPGNLVDQAEYLDRLSRENSLISISGGDGFYTVLRVAHAVAALRKAMDNSVLDSVLELQNTKLGFLTDQKQGYPAEVVRDCLIEAVLRGARPFGNEFNIIAGGCYLTKEFYTRIVPKLPGVTELIVSFGVPRTMGEKGAIVECSASWKLYGVAQSLPPSPDKSFREIPVRVNAGMGIDAILGKATRKAYKLIHDQITGWTTSDGDAEETDLISPLSAPTPRGGLKPPKSDAPPPVERQRVSERDPAEGEGPTAPADPPSPAPEKKLAEKHSVTAISKLLEGCQTLKAVDLVVAAVYADQRYNKSERDKIEELVAVRRKKIGTN